MLTKKSIYRLVYICFVAFVGLVGYRIWLLNSSKFISFDKQLEEVSGIEFDKNLQLWAINDGGDSPRLYQLSANGDIKRSIKIENAKNWDWEDMTQNDFGHFFIGDFGNNDNDREWLTIYKIENPIDIKTDTTRAEIIKFTNPEFKPIEGQVVRKNAHYDVEAFIYYQRSLYLFTKNRSRPFDGKTRLYRIGDYAGNFETEYINEFSTCTTIKELCWITSAALSPDRTKLVLLDSERLWLFENWQGDDFFSGDVYQIDLGIVTQKEAVTFYNDEIIVFTDEVFSGIGGNGYAIKLDQVKKKLIQQSGKALNASDANEELSAE
ncbi:hypothetical protein [Neptunomonas qingdaonensis]|uniref:SdiA-regulated n=1 Tax=Neptunomonas qingdaonensis TaxID=1045558 RepID=A0A1I2S908_9GAMM|nr:hypothetical protein [Neptunomonas qingdaonensis]SFG48169.1 hypothetical protein SAMN05216175_107126 [Neptunomonas qingdaonensis]